MKSELDKLNFFLSTPVDEIRKASFSDWSVAGDNSSGMKGFTGEPEMAIGSVLGYRWWHMPLEGSQALTGAYGGSWEPGRDVHEGECRRWARILDGDKKHTVPDPACGCGFWAYWKPEANSTFSGSRSLAVVQGIIEGFGLVLIGDKGFRCGKARLKGLALDRDYLRSMLDKQRQPFAQHEWGANSTFAAITGRSPYVHRPIPEDVVIRAVAELETSLEEMYPTARIFSSMESMQKYFGFDKNYGYMSARHAALAAMGKEALSDALVKVQSKAWELATSYVNGKLCLTPESIPLSYVKQVITTVREVLAEL